MSKDTNQDAHIFHVDTRFQTMARRPGGVAREQALASAQAQVDELKSDSTDWLDRELHELGAALAEAKDNPSNTASLDRAYRSCSRLRDVGATKGFELVAFVANYLCKIIDAIKAGAAYDEDMIDCHFDAFFLARTESYCHMRPEQVPELASGLRRVIELAGITAAEKSK